jgi:exopolysaccharide production protein ExoZ
MASKPPVKRIDSLQAGRALAALAVVFHHSDQTIANQLGGDPHWLAVIVSRGNLGVDFFFVLSGFIIYRTNAGKTDEPGWASYFVWSRIHRIYPPYLPIGLAMAALYTLSPGLSGSVRVWEWLPTLTLFPVGEPALSVAWTLQHEVAFYAIIWLLFAARRLLWGFLLWAAAILFIHQTKPFELINLEFLFGVCAAWAFLNEKLRWDFVLAAAGSIVIIAFFALGSDDYRIAFGLGLAMLLLPVVRLEKSGRLNVPPFLVRLGAESYALYLVHLPLVVALARLFHKARMPWFLAFPVLVAAAVVAAKLYYRFYEQTSVVQRLGPRKRRPAAIVPEAGCVEGEIGPKDGDRRAAP